MLSIHPIISFYCSFTEPHYLIYLDHSALSSSPSFPELQCKTSPFLESVTTWPTHHAEVTTCPPPPHYCLVRNIWHISTYFPGEMSPRIGVTFGCVSGGTCVTVTNFTAIALCSKKYNFGIYQTRFPRWLESNFSLRTQIVRPIILIQICGYWTYHNYREGELNFWNKT